MNLNLKQKIEISHDILASEVYARIDADEKMRLKIIQFLQDRYDYYVETGTLLDKKDLEYIGPYVDKVQLKAVQANFIKQSKREVEAKTLKRRWRNLIIGSILVIAAVVSTFFAIKLNLSNERLRDREVALRDSERELTSSLNALKERQKEAALARYQRYFESGQGKLNDSDYENAINEFDQALKVIDDYVKAVGTDSSRYAIDEGGIKATSLLETAKETANREIEFNRLIKEGDELLDGKPEYFIVGKRKYQQALRLKVNNRKANTKIELVNSRLKFALKEFKRKADKFFEAGSKTGYTFAQKYYEYALQIEPNNMDIQDQVAKCKSKLHSN